MNKLRYSGRMMVGLLFLYAGVYKTFHPAESIFALRALEFSRSFAAVSIFLVTVGEIYLGLLLLLSVEPRPATLGAITCLGCFTIFLWYLGTLAHPPSCGCPDLMGIFKSNREKVMAGMVRNTALILLLVWTFPRKTIVSPERA